MSKTVQELMGDTSSLEQHRKRWLKAFRDDDKLEGVNDRKREIDSLTLSELKAVKSIRVPEKFEVRGMAWKLDSTIKAVNGQAQEYSTTPGVHDWTKVQPWMLERDMSQVHWDSGVSNTRIFDEEILGKISTSTGGAAPNSLHQILRTAVTAKMTRRGDMKHMFCKAYLILQDFNLAMTTGWKKMEQDEALRLPLVQNCDAQVRMGLIRDRKVVIDAQGLAPQELGLLALCGAEYPSVRYAGANTYTSVNMESDDLAIISSDAINVDGTFQWGSTDRLYHLIISLASKLGMVDDMWDAFEIMRPIPCAMQTMLPYVDQRIFQIPVGPSYYAAKAFGSVKQSPRSEKPAGYLSCSAALVADIITGQMHDAMCTLIVDQLTLNGSVFNFGDLKSSPQANGITRDYGLTGSDIQANELMKAWSAMNGRPFPVCFGVSMKYLVINRAIAMRTQDIKWPAVIGLMPGIHSAENVWGYMKGWRGIMPVLEDSIEDREEQQALTALFGWFMGFRELRPDVGRGRRKGKMVMLNSTENRFMSGRGNKWSLEEFGFTLSSPYTDRTDPIEVNSSGLYGIIYKGEETNIVYNELKGWSFECKEDDPEIKRQGRESGAVREIEEERQIPVVPVGAIPPRPVSRVMPRAMPKPMTMKRDEGSNVTVSSE
nr:P4 [Diaporthe pseudophoenicicola chrysovirus 1]